MEMLGTAQVINAMCPLANLFGYAGDLRNITQGRAAFSMQFEHYEAVPFAIAEEIIEQKRAAATGGV
jgi:elongation factor G